MITATAAIAEDRRTAEPRDVRAPEEGRSPSGARLTMPAKMMKLMPLPIPFSVISSPSHIRTTAPAVSDDLGQRLGAAEVERRVTHWR